MQKRHYYYVLAGIGLLVLGGMVSFDPGEALAAIGFTPVRDVTSPALQPFQHKATIGIPAGLLGDDALFAVPAGKRLVIEFVSFNVYLPAGQDVTYLWVQINNPSRPDATFYFPATFQASDFVGGQDVYQFVAASPTRLYADPGSTVELAVRRTSDVGEGLASVSVSGHLVNVP